MNSLFSSNWLVLANSIVFWLTPIALAINLAIVKDRSNSYKQKIAYSYSIIWAIAFIIYLIMFLDPTTR